jgi:ABC-type uncharacterized transport system permease subunit
VLAHAALVALRWEADGGTSLAGWGSLSAIALATALLWVWMARAERVHGTGALVVTCVFALQLAASALAAPDPVSHLDGADAGSQTVNLVHALTGVGATATLALSGLHGLLYLLVYRGMRQRSFDVLSRLPPLDDLARLTRRAAFAGFLLLAVGVNFGIWLAHKESVRGFSYTDPFVVVMLFLWVHFGIVAFSRRIPGFTARRASWAAAAGFLLLVASLVVSILPRLSFHWSS